jgi:hypothetical protein
MARLKLKQVISNLQFDTTNDQLIISASLVTISGSVEIISTSAQTGSLTIQGVDTFGDSGSFNSIDLGSY